LKKKITNLLKFLLFLGLGFSILYIVYQHQNVAYQAECQLKGIPLSECSLLEKVVQDFKGVNYFWIFMVLAAYVVSNISRMIRWNFLVRPLGYAPRSVNSFFSIMLGYFANLGLPRMGEVVRAGSLARYEKIPLQKVMGTVVVDRMLDVLSLATVISLAFLLEFDTLWTFVQESRSSDAAEEGSLLSSNLIWLLLGIVAILGLCLLLFFKQIQRTNFYKKLVNFIIGFAEGIKSIRNLKKPWLFVFHSLNIWFMYFLMTYMGMLAFEPTAHLGMVVGLTVFAAGGLGIVIPSPGGMGTYHALVIGALALYEVAGEEAFSFANILFFSVNIGANILLGLLALILLPIVNKNYHPEPCSP
jgi:glycosyltransferase 2 family protein